MRPTNAFGDLEAGHGKSLGYRRFRPNVIIGATADPGEWAGKMLAFGNRENGTELLVTNHIPRCAIITIDPDTGFPEPGIMRTVANSFDKRFGYYAIPTKAGLLNVGDPVFLAS